MTEYDLFTSALSQADPARRAAFLDQVCADDPEQRRRIEVLLKAHELAGGFLEDAAPAPEPTGSMSEGPLGDPVPASVAADGPGRRIGPYKLLQGIGQGGMGTVFMAEQETPVRRKIALKVIKAGMDTRQVIARFEAERQALAIRERLAREDPSNVQFQSDLASSHYHIGRLQSSRGRKAEALASHEQARAILERLVSKHPSAIQHQADLAQNYNNIGLLQSQMDRPSEALESYKRAIPIRVRLARENPSVTQYQRDLAQSHNNLGLLQRTTGQPTDARASLEQGHAIWARLATEHPEAPDFNSGAGASLNNVAISDLHERQFEKARAKLTRAIQWQRKALAANPDYPIYRERLTTALSNLILAARGLGRDDEAAEARRELDVLESSDPELVALDVRLTAVLEGEGIAKDEDERTRLADRAHKKSLYASSARLYAEALANDPKLADNLQARHRYNAACAAAQASSGWGMDAPPPEDAVRADLRNQAREWLQAELAAWAKVLDTGPADLKAKIAPTLRGWKADSDLAAIRDEKALARMPGEERAALKTLWNDVDQLLARVPISR